MIRKSKGKTSGLNGTFRARGRGKRFWEAPSSREAPTAPGRIVNSLKRLLEAAGKENVWLHNFMGSPVEIIYESQCPKCKADLRCCKNCGHFDTAAQFECTQRIPERITKKDIRNNCEFFVARVSIERETRDSGGGNKGPAPSVKASDASDARNAFDNLFKK